MWTNQHAWHSGHHQERTPGPGPQEALNLRGRREMQKTRIHQYPQKKSKGNQRYAPHLPPAGPSLLDIEVSWAI